MLDLSKVPVVDSNVKICSYMSISKIRCIKLEDMFSNSTLYFPESKFNKYFKMFKTVLENEETYNQFYAISRGHKWFKPTDIDNSLKCWDYFMVERVPIYIEMFKHISRYKVRLDKDSLLSQNLYILEEVNKKIKNRKKLNKIKNLPYLSL
jgi:hypothetical protein